MNPTLLRIAQFVARRPSDRTIHMLHICIGLIIIALLWFAQDRSVIDVPFYSDRHPLSPEAEKMIEYSLLVLGALPIIK